MNWLLLAISAPIFFVSYQALSRLLPKDLSIFLVNAYASFIGMIFMLIMHFSLSQNKSISIGSRELAISVGIGILISIGNFFIIKAFSLGAPQTLFTAVFNPLYIVYGVLVGLFIWHEKLNIYQIGGILMAISGIVIMAYFKK